ncbi:calcium/proton exchanger [Phycomyces blakesleeanus]|uniref:Vacuolar calcium ion transporter n=1 Tax=Phycomyces blakesleeanus TaxID=4837 RepID=A0ABR3ARD0_PHYBL
MDPTTMESNTSSAIHLCGHSSSKCLFQGSTETTLAIPSSSSDATESNNRASTPEHVNFTPDKTKAYSSGPTPIQGLSAIFFSSWLNLLLIFIPFGIISHFLWSPTVTFILNFISIIPLARMLGFVTEDISLRTGEVIGGLLNASFGNAVELIISIIALTKNLVVVVQASMLGSIISNLLLVLGMCFIGGGLKFKEQSFNVTVAQTSASLLFIAVSSLVVPAAFYSSSRDSMSPLDLSRVILNISRATAIILLIIYFSYLYFQLKTHNHLNHFTAAEESLKIHATPKEIRHSQESLMKKIKKHLRCLHGWLFYCNLFLITVLVSISAEFLVSAIESVVEQWHISQTFVGLVLLPIVGNAAEHVSAVTVAIKNKMDLALSIAVGSSMQIALFVTPLMVLLGWILDVDMSLFFNIYETAVLFIAVIMVSYLIMDGKSNWLEGMMLCSVYIIIAISFYYYPDSASGLA